jgi:hypothetical protein
MGPIFLKGSSATSARATTAQADSARSSGNASRSAGQAANRPSLTANGGYPLAGISNLPDPDFHAYRQDLADVALAGCVIASHYAEPLLRHVVAAAPFRSAADDQAEIITELRPGDEMWVLDDTSGWAWGYGGADRRVGYIRAEALGA